MRILPGGLVQGDRAAEFNDTGTMRHDETR